MKGPPVDRTSCESTGTKSARARAGAGPGATIWIDLDNTPHVPFFKPIIRELEARGFRVVLTARDAFQVCDLAAQSGLRCRTIGRHYGKNRVMKMAGLALRGAQLLPPECSIDRACVKLHSQSEAGSLAWQCHHAPRAARVIQGVEERC